MEGRLVANSSHRGRVFSEFSEDLGQRYGRNTPAGGLGTGAARCSPPEIVSQGLSMSGVAGWAMTGGSPSEHDGSPPEGGDASQPNIITNAKTSTARSFQVRRSRPCGLERETVSVWYIAGSYTNENKKATNASFEEHLCGAHYTFWRSLCIWRSLSALSMRYSMVSAARGAWPRTRPSWRVW